MRINLLILLMSFSIPAFSQIKYPDTKKVNQENNYFGTIVKDPYRWLEDDNSEATKAWVKEDTAVTDQYFSQIPFREKVKEE